MATKPNIGIFGSPKITASKIFNNTTQPVASSVVKSQSSSVPANTAFTYQQAIAFRDGPIGSQIPRIERLLRPSNWNNLSGGLKAQYLKEIQGAVNDPIKYSFDQLKKDAASYLIFQNLPGGGGTAKAEAIDLKSNIDKYVNYLTSNNQSVASIMSTIDKGYVEGGKSLQEQVGRMNQTSVIDKVADVGLQIGLATATANLSLPAQIGINGALQVAKGENPADVVRNVVGTVAANSLTQGIPGIESSKIIPKTLNELNKAIENIAPDIVNSTVGSALINAERQAVAALITKQDVGQNAIAGAIGGTVADIAKVGFDDPLTQKTIGEYAKYNALGMSPQDAALMAGVDYLGDLSSESTNRPSNQPDDSMSPTTAASGSKIGSSLAASGDIDFTVPSEIASKAQFKTMPGEVGENIIQYTDKDGIVTYQKRVTAETPIGNKVGYTIVYDPELNSFSYDYSTGTETISSKIRPSLTTPTVPEVTPSILSTRITGAQSGQRKQGEDFGISTVTQKATTPIKESSLQPEASSDIPIEEMPTISLLRRVRVGDETRPNIYQEEKSLPATETVAKREQDIPEIQRLVQSTDKERSRIVEEEPIAQRKPTESVILDLISGGSRAQQASRQQRIPSERELASMQALSQALSVGDPGDALFGSGLGRRRNVWNVESLRLKDELGG